MDCLPRLLYWFKHPCVRDDHESFFGGPDIKLAAPEIRQTENQRVFDGPNAAIYRRQREANVLCYQDTQLSRILSYEYVP